MTQPSREELLPTVQWLRDMGSKLINGTIVDGDIECAKMFEAAEELERLLGSAQELWLSGDSIPPVERGHIKEFIVAVHRQHSGKVYTFACSYLNAHRVQYEFCAKDETKEGFCDGCEDGCPTTGWFILTGDDNNESGCYQTLSLKDGDKIVGWQELPRWTSPVSSTHQREGGE